MALQISGLISRAQKILQDALGTRWDGGELLGWFNDGRRELAVYRPGEFARRVAVTLNAGTLQQLPEGAFLLLRVACNLRSTSPRLPGRVVTSVERRILDSLNPGWEDPDVVALAREAKHFCYEPEEPRVFHVYPGNDGYGIVEAIFAMLPAEETNPNAPLGVRDVFGNALLDYMLYRAFNKDADHPGNAERAAAHYASFSAAMGITGAVQAGGGE